MNCYLERYDSTRELFSVLFGEKCATFIGAAEVAVHYATLY